jgi:hypothetical protein
LRLRSALWVVACGFDTAQPTGVGMDSAWEQKKLKARKMLDCPCGRAARREAPTAEAKRRDCTLC